MVASMACAAPVAAEGIGFRCQRVWGGPKEVEVCVCVCVYVCVCVCDGGGGGGGGDSAKILLQSFQQTWSPVIQQDWC